MKHAAFAQKVPSHQKAPSQRGLSPTGDWGSVEGRYWQ